MGRLHLPLSGAPNLTLKTQSEKALSLGTSNHCKSCDLDPKSQPLQKIYSIISKFKLLMRDPWLRAPPLPLCSPLQMSQRGTEAPTRPSLYSQPHVDGPGSCPGQHMRTHAVT